MSITRSPGLASRQVGSSGGLAAAVAAARRPQPHHRLAVRCLASKGGDKSWSGIAAEAAELGKDLVKKVGSSVSKAVEAIMPSTREEERPTRREPRRGREDVYSPEDLGFGGGLVGGLLGRAVGGMLRSAVGAMGEQLRQAAEQVADVQDRAARVIENNSRIRDKLGGPVRVLPPVSQSSMTQSINGKASRTITLLLPVVGPSGAAAQAQVQYVEGGAATQELNVSVRLPNGELVRLDGASTAAGQTIDVEWRSVDDK
ncbi:hypothetical protein ABPG75_013397 [Micractinium tetrahymenae]